MKIFGKTISEYARFEGLFLALIAAVGLARLGLSLGGVANSVDKFLSLTVLMLIGLFFYSVWVYVSGFGGYKQLYPVFLLQWLVGQAIIISGIIIAIESGKDNIFSAPEFSPKPGAGRTWAHAISHVVLIIVAPLIFWVIGLLIMFITKKITGGSRQKAGTANA